MGQADEAQQDKWLPPSQRLEVIGTYAQVCTKANYGISCQYLVHFFQLSYLVSS